MTNLTRRAITLLFLLAMCATRGFATDYPPADHGGADVTLANGDVIWGVHTNIGAFDVPTSTTVRVAPYYPDQPGTGFVEIHANDIVVSGTLSARGAGYTGGGGYAGYKNTGADGKGRYQKIDGSEFVGSGDQPASAVTDRDDTMFLLMGIGGGGGTKISPIINPPYEGAYGGNGGGGSGGGVIKLLADDALTITGTINTQGVFFGQNGQDAAKGGAGGNSDPEEEGEGGAASTGCYWEIFPDIHQECGPGLPGGHGSAGHGGGVLLYCPSHLSILASRAVFLTDDLYCHQDGEIACFTGGTVKIFYHGEKPQGGEFHTKWVRYIPLEEFDNSMWMIE